MARALDDHWDASRTLPSDRAEESWFELPHEKLLEYADTLYFMDSAGWRYHLPAFMVRSLEYDSCVFLDEAVLQIRHATTPPYRHLDSLTQVQKKALVAYVRFVKDCFVLNSEMLELIDAWQTSRIFPDEWLD